MKIKIIAIIVCLLLVLCLFPAVSLAAAETIDLAGYPGGSTITIHTGDTATVTDSAPAERTNIQIVCEAGVSVTLSGVNINNSATDDACPISFTGGSNTLTLAAGTTNTLTGGLNEPAVRAEDTTELTIDGTGTLNATGGGAGAGIGGGRNSDGGDITIESGTIDSTDGGVGAGIGGGYFGGSNRITINGGNVTATGHDNGAGIGSAMEKNGGVITITGGNVTATAVGLGVTGAGIGSGAGRYGATIIISGGNVTAISTNGGAGIGCGYSAAGCTVSITGGFISATGSNGGYDIGKGGGSTGGGPDTLSMDGCANVTLNSIGTSAAVTKGDCYITGAGAGSLAGAYIDGTLFSGTIIDMSTGTVTGSGASYSSPTVTITDSAQDYLVTGSTTANKIVAATGTSAATDVVLFGASIQPGSGCAFDMTGSNVNIELYGKSILKSSGGAGLMVPAGAEVSISGDGSLTSQGGSRAAGIGGGSGSACGTVVIKGGTVNATGGNNAAGIGGGDSGGAGSITITDGTVVASTGGGFGCGIGCGNIGYDGNITISGGDVTATSGRYGAAGIGGAGNVEIDISGGNVHATGREAGAGIGGRGANLKILISGGTITANAEGGGAGIGSEDTRRIDQIIITGGNVTASGGNGSMGLGSGLGGGFMGGCNNITISGGTVFATRGFLSSDDIGDTGSGMTLNISGSAAVFLKNDSCTTPATTTHMHYTDNKSYGITMPAGWTTFGSYLRICKLSYDANNGSGTVPAEVTQLYQTTTAAANGSGLTRTGYGYNGWNTKADGSGTGYAAGDTFTFTADSTLYAKWAANNYTVEYNANGGTGTTASSSHVYDAAKALTANEFTRTGYTFAGWAESAGGAAVYIDGQSVKNLAATDGAKVTLYAKWAANAYTVEYNPNGGAGTTASSSHVYDAAKALTANGFTRTGYTFAGWAESAGGAALYTDGQSVKNLTSANGANVTLYAKWTAVPQIASSINGGSVFTGGRITLTPNIPGGTWSFDASMLSRDGNTFTAIKTGTVRVTYTVEGQSTYYDITAKAAELPKTGQDGTLIYVLAGLAAALVAATVLAGKYKRVK